MPPMTPIRKFLDSLASGETNMTKRLKQIFDNIDTTGPVFTWFITADLSKPLPTSPIDVRKFLRDEGLSKKEIDHIDDWPSDPKKDARDAVVAAVTAGTAIEHRWGLTHGPKAAVDLPTPANGQTITYLSSQQKLTPALWAALGEVNIDA